MMNKMRVTIPSGNSIFQCDAIMHEGAIWLVPTWIEVPSERCTKPERIIPLSALQHQMMPSNSPFGNYLVGEPVPDQVLTGTPTLEQMMHYRVQMRPDISFPAGAA